MGNGWRVIKGGELLDAKSGKAEGLLICLCGYWDSSYEPLRKIADQISLDLPNIDILLLKTFDKALGWRANPLQFVKKHLVTIDHVCAGKTYRDIRFLSYSMGATVARKVFAAAFATAADSKPLEPDLKQTAAVRSWHLQVTRLTFIAGFARGWIVSPRMGFWTRIFINIVGCAGHLWALLPSKGEGDFPFFFSIPYLVVCCFEFH